MGSGRQGEGRERAAILTCPLAGRGCTDQDQGSARTDIALSPWTDWVGPKMVQKVGGRGWRPGPLTNVGHESLVVRIHHRTRRAAAG